MATASDVVSGALRLIGAIAAGESASASEAADGLEALNQMMHGLAHEGVHLEHAVLALAGSVNLPETHIEALKYLLAIRLAPEYALTPSPLVIRQADHGKAMLQAVYADPQPLSIDRGLLRMPSQNWGSGR